MTLPSTEELQRLLDEATPGEWKWDGTVRRSLYSKDAEGKGRDIMKCAALLYPDEADAEIIALAPVLAAEVIRLREAIETVAQISETRARNCHESNQLVAAAGHTVTASHLHGILEGDQE